MKNEKCKMSNTLLGGFVDPISLFAVVFLLVSLTLAVPQVLKIQNIGSKASCSTNPGQCKSTEECINGVCKLIAKTTNTGSNTTTTTNTTSSATGCGSKTTSATCTGCGAVKADGVSSYSCKWLSASSSCVESASLCGGSAPTGPIGSEVVSNSYASCSPSPTYAWCGGCGGFCIKVGSQSCSEVAQSKCGVVTSYVGPVCDASSNGAIVVNGTSDGSYFVKCNGVLGKWEPAGTSACTTCLSQMNKANVPTYLQAEYDTAVKAITPSTTTVIAGVQPDKIANPDLGLTAPITATPLPATCSSGMATCDGANLKICSGGTWITASCGGYGCTSGKCNSATLNQTISNAVPASNPFTTTIKTPSPTPKTTIKPTIAPTAPPNISLNQAIKASPSSNPFLGNVKVVIPTVKPTPKPTPKIIIPVQMGMVPPSPSPTSAPTIGTAKEGYNCYDKIFGLIEGPLSAKCATGLHCSQNICVKDVVTPTIAITPTKVRGNSCTDNSECITGLCAKSYFYLGKLQMLPSLQCVPSLAEQDAGIVQNDVTKAVVTGGAAAIALAPVVVPQAIAIAANPVVQTAAITGVSNIINAGTTAFLTVGAIDCALGYANELGLKSVDGGSLCNSAGQMALMSAGTPQGLNQLQQTLTSGANTIKNLPGDIALIYNKSVAAGLVSPLSENAGGINIGNTVVNKAVNPATTLNANNVNVIDDTSTGFQWVRNSVTGVMEPVAINAVTPTISQTTSNLLPSVTSTSNNAITATQNQALLNTALSNWITKTSPTTVTVGASVVNSLTPSIPSITSSIKTPTNLLTTQTGIKLPVVSNNSPTTNSTIPNLTVYNFQTKTFEPASSQFLAPPPPTNIVTTPPAPAPIVTTPQNPVVAFVNSKIVKPVTDVAKNAWELVTTGGFGDQLPVGTVVNTNQSVTVGVKLADPNITSEKITFTPYHPSNPNPDASQQVREYVLSKTEIGSVIDDPLTGEVIDSYQILLDLVKNEMVTSNSTPIQAINAVLKMAKPIDYRFITQRIGEIQKAYNLSPTNLKQAYDFLTVTDLSPFDRAIIDKQIMDKTLIGYSWEKAFEEVFVKERNQIRELDAIGLALQDQDSISAKVLCKTRINCLETPVIQEALLKDLDEQQPYTLIVGFGGTQSFNDFPYTHGALIIRTNAINNMSKPIDLVYGYNLQPQESSTFQQYANDFKWGQFNLPDTKITPQIIQTYVKDTTKVVANTITTTANKVTGFFGLGPKAPATVPVVAPSVPNSTTTQKLDQIVSNGNDYLSTQLGGSKSLGCREMLCETSSEFIANVSKDAGLPSQKFEVRDLNMARGIPKTDSDGIYNSFGHYITIITDPVTNDKYLVDLTFNQFVDPDRKVIRNTNRTIYIGPLKNYPIAQELIDKGYIKLTDQTLNDYLNMTTKVEAAQQITIKDLDNLKTLNPVQPQNSIPTITSSTLTDPITTSTNASDSQVIAGVKNLWLNVKKTVIPVNRQLNTLVTDVKGINNITTAEEIADIKIGDCARLSLLCKTGDAKVVIFQNTDGSFHASLEVINKGKSLGFLETSTGQVVQLPYYTDAGYSVYTGPVNMENVNGLVQDYQAIPPTDIYIRAREIEDVLNIANTSPDIPVVVSGTSGAGKTTFMNELARKLKTDGQNPFLISIHSFNKEEVDDVLMNLRKLDSKVKQLILFDSSDSFFQFRGKKTIQQLSVQKTFTKEEETDLSLYNRYGQIFTILSDPNFKVITTVHSDWIHTKVEPDLNSLWNEKFSDANIYELGGKVDPDIALKYLSTNPNLKFTDADLPYLEKIADRYMWMDLKLLTQAKYLELKSWLQSTPEKNWDIVVRLFRNGATPADFPYLSKIYEQPTSPLP